MPRPRRCTTWLVSAALVLLVAGVATADRVVTLSSARVAVTHVVAIPLPDAGWRMRVCAEVRQADGGSGRAPDADCIDCEPGAWNGAPATCRTAWKDANGL